MEKASVKQEKAKAAIGIGHAWENKAFDNQDDPALLNQALESYKKAEELGATSPDAKSHLAYEAMLGSARVLTQLGKLAEAKAVYEKVIAERPYHEEKMDEVSDEQWMQWPSLSREDKSRLVRKSLKDMQAVASFQSLAKSRLEKLEVLIRETEQKAQ
jgi:tetratricopeptide (TPR) repeat protein